MVINQWQDLVEDTYMQVGSEAYTAALGVYTYAKNSPSGTALYWAQFEQSIDIIKISRICRMLNLWPRVVEDLSRRFARKPRPTEPKPNDKRGK